MARINFKNFVVREKPKKESELIKSERINPRNDNRKNIIAKDDNDRIYFSIIFMFQST